MGIRSSPRRLRRTGPEVAVDWVVLGEVRGVLLAKEWRSKGMGEGADCLALPENPENCLAKRLRFASMGGSVLPP